MRMTAACRPYLLAADNATITNSDSLVGTIPAFDFISGVVCAILLAGRWLQKMLGNVGLSIATRILGLLVAAIGVQFIVIGVTHTIVWAPRKIDLSPETDI